MAYGVGPTNRIIIEWIERHADEPERVDGLLKWVEAASFQPLRLVSSGYE